MHRTYRLIGLIPLLALAGQWTPLEGPSPRPSAAPEAVAVPGQAVGQPASVIPVAPEAAEIASPTEADLELVVSRSSNVEAVNASAAQSDRLIEAVAKFTELGLALPDLEVRFATDEAACDGHMGLFEASYRPWRISICSSADFVYEHELAHAWELANATDWDRANFMAFWGLERWNHPDDDWSERGVEMAAFIIQQGLLDTPVRSPPTELQSRLKAFELLTGIASSRVAQSVNPSGRPEDEEPQQQRHCLDERPVGHVQRDQRRVLG